MRKIQSGILTQAQIQALDGATVLDPATLDAAIIDISGQPAVAVYDYNKLVDIFAAEAADGKPPADEEYMGAVEWVDYNIVRGLPYMGTRAPLVVLTTFDDDFVEDDEPLIEGKYLRC